MTTKMTHVFDHLGQPPYRIRRFEPAQGARFGTCDHCSTAILEKYFLESADAKQFKVGNQCIYKAGDAGLRKEVDKLRQQARHASEDKQADQLRAWLDQTEVIDKLDSLPSPVRFGTLLSYVNFCLANAGRSGKARAYRMVKKVIGERDHETETAEHPNDGKVDGRRDRQSYGWLQG